MWLDVSGSYVVGGRLDITLSGEPTSIVYLGVGFGPDDFVRKRLGTVLIDFTGVKLIPWTPVPSTDSVTVPPVTTPFPLHMQAAAFYPGARILSNAAAIVVE